MSYIGFLQGLGVRHLFTLNNEGTSTNHDLGDSSDPTRIDNGSYSFVAEPVCYGVTHCLRTVTSTNESTPGAELDNRNDINASNGAGNDSSSYDWNTGTKQVYFWARQKEIWNVTCLFEQGGGVNNLAVMGGARSTWQAADSGQPFLIVPAKTLSIKNRAILHWGGWEYRTQTGQPDNRVWYTENGVMQGYNSAGGTASFPNHSGDPGIGNSDDNLQTFNSDTLASQTVASDSNFWGMRNNPPVLNIAEGDIFPEAREAFERAVIGENVISGTVAQQQSQIDALSGTVFRDVNCAIEIRQATDATDYTLTFDNIQFVQNPNLRDIAVKYVGPNTLTIINSNGSNAEEVSAPVEQDLDGSTILVGGGSVVIRNQYEFTLTGIDPGSKVYLFNSDLPETDAEYELKKELVTGSTFTYQFDDAAPINASYAIHKLDRQVIERDVALFDSNVTVPIAQGTDRNYENN